MTNLPSKRGFSSISGDGFAKNKENESGNSAFAKKVCLQVENLVKDMSGKGKSEVDGSEKISSLLKNKQCCGALPSSGRENVVSVVSKAKDKNNEMPDLGVTIAHNFMEHGDALRDNCLSSVSIPMCSKKDIDGERIGSDTTGDDVGDEELVAKQVCNDKDVGAGRLVSSKFGSIEWSRLPKSQGSRSFELERCSVLKDDGCANLSAGSDLLKDCSCSFCSKVLFVPSFSKFLFINNLIFSPPPPPMTLVVKKSQRDASFLVQKWGRAKDSEIPDHGNSNKSTKLESELMSKWRSLFLHMEGIFGHESNELQAGYVSLKDLRENCKMDLERTTGMPSDNQ
ncbi:dna-directed rna polymerase subunit beta [Citrus sinensis]|nr:dna-directed rna polymerase subunit beta [Citrus sinensis]